VSLRSSSSSLARQISVGFASAFGIFIALIGRAEYLRLALSINGTPFRDHRLSEDEFVQMKKDGKLPYGVVPILEVCSTTCILIALTHN
jgi:hypothetical protein